MTVGLAFRSGDGMRTTVVAVSPVTPPVERPAEPAKRKRGRPPKVK